MASMPNIFRLSFVVTLIFLRFHSINRTEARLQTKKCSQKNIISCQSFNKLSLLSDDHPSYWPRRPSGYFRFGFYEEGNGFKVGIWLVSDDKITVVWTAIRDDPPVDSNSTLEFTADCELVLSFSEQGKPLKKVLIKADKRAISASLLDSGNFVICNNDSNVVWESFEHPTDTILQGQELPSGGELLASASEMDHSPGRFRLKMQEDGNLVLYPTNSEDFYIDAYWASDTYMLFGGHKFHLYLNLTGRLSIINTTSSEQIHVLNNQLNVNLSNTNVNKIFRATIDYDGVFRLYSHSMPINKFEKQFDYQVSEEWRALENPCAVKGFCGLNNYCTLNDGKPSCVCIPGTEYGDEMDKGARVCFNNYSRIGCQSDGKENVTFYEIYEIEHTKLLDIPYMESQMSNEKECRESCLEDCNCQAAVFEPTGSCKKQKLPLRYVLRDFDNHFTAFFKVRKGRNTTPLWNETNQYLMSEFPNLVVTSKRTLAKILVLTLTFVLFSCIALVTSGFFIVKIRILRYKRLREDALGLDTDGYGLLLKVFLYDDLKIATKGFKEELGKGSFGAVYKGSLNKGRKLIAVKRLEKLVEEGEREFRAEMRAIGMTNHKNLVQLLGYCAEGSKRLLVYEYMSNGSLANHLFTQESRVEWDERVRIATDVARGILYLHEGCRMPIIHCDIKPQNILMDEFWTAKISDFGLAKFLMPDQTRTLTGVRGTRGYLAPEWSKNTPISVKADVYSYGIVLLEIVCCRRNWDFNKLRQEEIVLSNWAYKCFSDRELNNLVDDEQVDRKTLENMVKVALWCIQDQPALRPSMKSVVLMLQGITEVAIPPCPTSP